MRHKPTTVEMVTIAAVGLVLVWAVVAFGCIGMYGEQYQQFGQELGRKRQEVRVPAEYQFVIDTGTKQYWPLEQKYVDPIPSANRVYVLDAAALAQFKGYKPGPL